MSLFSWVHLSDLRFGDGAGRWDNAMVLACLREDVGALCAAEGRPDAIFVTGGIALGGGGGDRGGRPYELARLWLTELGRAVGVGPSRIFVVPGADDVGPVAQAARARSVKRLVERLRAGAEGIDEAIADDDDRSLLMGRLSQYVRFAEGLGPLATGAEALPREVVWSHRVTGSQGLAVRVAGLNTVLLCDGSDAGGDRGRLQVGVGQLGAALGEHGDGELFIVLSHHPFQGGWLADQRAAEGWIESRAHIHVTGCADGVQSVQADKGYEHRIVRVSAGAPPSERDASGGRPFYFNVTRVVMGEGGALELRVWHRRWSSTRKAFVADVDAIPAGQWFASHALDRGLAKKLALRGEAQPAPPLGDDFRTRCELLERRIREALRAEGAEEARSSALLLEKELNRYVASVDDDLRRARAGRGEGADGEAMHRAIRDLRTRARRTLARVKLGVLLGEGRSPEADAAAEERDVFACTGALVALGEREDVELLRRAEERWPYDFLAAHRKALLERATAPRPPDSRSA